MIKALEEKGITSGKIGILIGVCAIVLINI